MVFGLENGLTVNKNLWNGDHVWQSVQLYVGGAKKKNKVKPLTWRCDRRIFELQFVAALLLFPDAEMYVGLEWWFLVCDNVSIQVNCFNPWSARSGLLWSYVGQEFIHLHYNVVKGVQAFGLTMETLRKPRRLWQQERGRTKGSMNASVAQHLRFNTRVS